MNTNKINNILKVFEIHIGGEVDTVCAYTNIHALQVHESITEMLLQDFMDDDYIIEVPKKKWKSIEITDPDNDNKVMYTLKEYMKTAKEPDIICSTAY